MKLLDLDFFFPVYKTQYTVCHGKPRRLLAFEQALLNLIRQFGNDENHGEFPVSQLFSEYLSVPEPWQFLPSVINNLQQAGYIALDIDGEVALSDQRLDQFQLTEKGLNAVLKGAIAGKPSYGGLELYFDPVHQRFPDKSERRGLLDNVRHRKIGDDQQPQTPQPVMQAWLQTHPPEWFAEGSEVISVETDTAKPFWKPVRGALTLTESGDLDIVFTDPAYRQFLMEQYSDTAQEIVEKELKALSEAPPINDLPLLSTDLFPELKSLIPTSSFFKRFPMSTTAIHFLRYHPKIEEQIRCKPERLIVVFEHLPEKYDDPIRWNREIFGAVIYLDENFPILNGHYVNTVGENFFMGRFPMAFREEKYELSLGYSFAAKSPRIETDVLLEVVEEMIDLSDDPEHQLIKLFWKPVEEVWAIIHQKITAEADDPQRKMQLLKHLREQIQRIRPGSFSASA